MLKHKFNIALSNELMDKIKSISCGVFSYNKNESIFKEGEQTKYLYFIEKGSISLNKLKDNSEVSFLEIPSGQLLGIDCVYTDGVCNYSALTKTSTKGVKILISDFLNLINDHKVASLELMKYLSSILNRIEKSI